MGRNREKLMTLILRAQAEENESMRETLIKWKDADIVVDDMFDPFWPITLPAVFQNVGCALARKPRLKTLAPARAQAKATERMTMSCGVRAA